MIELPVGLVDAERVNPKVLLLYSPPKLGKTTMLSKLEDCLIIDLEEGTKFLKALKVKVNNLGELGEVSRSILAKGKPYKYVAIDTISELESWCEIEATNQYRQSPIGKNFTGKSVLELPNGAGYLHLRLMFKKWIDALSTLADNIILVGHIKDKLIEIGGKEVSSKDIELTGKNRNITCAGADGIGYMYRKDGKIQVTFKSSEEITCGSRCEHLKGQEFEFDWNKIYLN